MRLARPSLEFLPSYAAALKRGWSPDNRRPEAAGEELARIALDPGLFIDQQYDPAGAGPAIVLPDGRTVPRLPGFVMWMWDGEFCGAISLRWQHGTTDLPPHCLGHIGYSVVPWKQRLGLATSALRQILPAAAAEGLAFVELRTESTNIPSQRVIEANGGVLIERLEDPAVHGGAESLRYRIQLR